jgi:hypothetical protein
MEGFAPSFSAHVRLGERGAPVLVRKGFLAEIDFEEGQGALVGGVCDVGAKDVAFARVHLGFAGEVFELAEAD